MKDLISIIIPVYNNEKFLKLCIESVVLQSYSNLEIILIDDGSTDSSGELCDRFAENDGRIVIVHQENGGVSKARNTGLNIATGKFILFVDSDDIVSLDYVEKLYNSVKNYDIAICGIVRMKINQCQDKKEIIPSGVVLNYEMLVINILSNNKVGGYLCNKIFRRSIITEHDLQFAPRFHIGEDMLWIIEYLKYCETGVVISEVLYYYRLNENSMLQYSIHNEKFDNKNYEALYVNDFIKKQIKLQSKEIERALAYRYIRSDMRLLFNMIVCREKNIKTFKIMKSHIKKYIKNYIQLSHVSRLEKIVACGMTISPNMVYHCGIYGYRMFKSSFDKYLS